VNNVCSPFSSCMKQNRGKAVAQKSHISLEVVGLIAGHKLNENAAEKAALWATEDWMAHRRSIPSIVMPLVRNTRDYA
jgi:hypothetical protein